MVQHKEFEFEINGIKIETPHQKLVAHDILELAEKHGALPSKPENYTLHGDKGEYKLDDWVDLEEDNKFFTVSTAPTQVA